MNQNASLRETALNLFGLGSGFQNGWVRATGTSAITGFVVYADLVAAGVAVVPVQSSPSSTLLFSHIADLSPWYTGLALLNPSTSATNVEVFAMNPNGTLIGSSTISLNPGTKSAKLLSEMIPQTQSRLSDGGFIFVRSSGGVAIYGLELFFTRSSSVLANVPASPVPAGITFTPPPR